MTKAGEEPSVRAAIDMKSLIHTALAKYNKLSISSTQPLRETEPATPTISRVKADSSTIPLITDLEWKFGSDIQESRSTTELELDPTTPHAQLARLKKRKQLNA